MSELPVTFCKGFGCNKKKRIGLFCSFHVGDGQTLSISGVVVMYFRMMYYTMRVVRYDGAICLLILLIYAQMGKPLSVCCNVVEPT